MKNYSVCYGETESRICEDFTTYHKAKVFALKCLEEKKQTIILDTYDEDGDLFEYESIK